MTAQFEYGQAVQCHLDSTFRAHIKTMISHDVLQKELSSHVSAAQNQGYNQPQLGRILSEQSRLSNDMK